MACAGCGSDAEPVSQMTPTGKRRTCGKCGLPAVPEPVTVAAARPAAAAPRARSIPLDPIKQIKARLRYLDGELKRMRKLETERAQLQKILRTVDAKPAAVVELRHKESR
jgi:hypothetical protein